MPIPINFQTKNLESTEALERYVVKRLSKLDIFVDDEDTSAMGDVELEKTISNQNSGDIYRAEINLHVKGKYLRAEASRDDMYAAIDEIRDEMLKELRRLKGKRETLGKRGARMLKQILRRG